MKFMLYDLVRCNPDGTKEVVDTVVLDQSSDDICIGGFGINGRYYQYDSYEGYNSHEFFSKHFDEHGLKVVSCSISIEREVLLKFKV